MVVVTCVILLQIRELVDTETHDLFQKKLRDRALRKEENFRWCAHVSILKHSWCRNGREQRDGCGGGKGGRWGVGW